MATSHRLKPKRLPSATLPHTWPTPIFPKVPGAATLPHTWPTPIFPYKGSKGHLPVEAQPYVFVSRKTGYGRKVNHKVVPEMVFPIQANRRCLQYGAEPGTLHLLNTRFGVPLDSFFWSGRINEVKDQLPELLAYNPGCHPPPGYMYQRFKQAHVTAPARTSAGNAKLTCPPVLLIRGPFQNVVRLRSSNARENIDDYDAAVIGRPLSRAIRIYNEPDAVSTLALEAEFDRSISERAKRVCATGKRPRKAAKSNHCVRTSSIFHH
ncbi:hypothetical protein ElyMa_005632100 [Elysia marginata]|uniref:Uncharacterized protein n=1 Tax=Elysia marginata TaxID=1093978 RepID=A0AAV4F8C1_9GAST|nr:hypothetical protein ElyMa_005632100 [Elysia marginata]